MTPELGDLIELEIKAVSLLRYRRGLGIDHRGIGDAWLDSCSRLKPSA